MKVKRVVVNDGLLEVGVVFDTGPKTVGRALVTLPGEACEAILAAAQVAFDAHAGEVEKDVQSTALTAELVRLRVAREDLSIVQRDHASAIDEHAKRIAEARLVADQDRERLVVEATVEAKRRLLEAEEALAAQRGAMDRLAKTLDERQQALTDAESAMARRQSEKEDLEKAISDLEDKLRLKAIVAR